MAGETREVHRGKVIRLCELTVTRALLENVTFEDCHLLGPAVVAVLDHNEFNGIVIDGELEAVLWEVPPERKSVIGAIGLQGCKLRNCRLTDIGLAGPREFAQRIRDSLGSSLADTKA